MPESQPNPRIDLDAKLEAEIEAALGDASLEDMLDVAERPRSSAGGGRHRGRNEPSEREIKTGLVVDIHGSDVLVEFGPKSQGVCPFDQFTEPPVVGQRLEFVVEQYSAADGLLLLSRQGAVRKAAWESLEVGQIVEARCTGVNKGGLEMEIAQHRAFMPAGQVDLRHIADLSVFVGEKMPCEVIELDRNRERIILSRRSQMEAQRTLMREKILGELELGKQLPAVITSIQNYGAFADIGGIDGLIHISDMSHSRLKHPSEAVKVGDTVQVKITKIDKEADPPRVGLGMKQCLADPYQSQVESIKPGDTVTGRVTKLMPFGAFVEITPGVEGLIHISELSNERVHTVSKVVKQDEIVTAKVLSIDPAQRRISLSLKALQQLKAETDFDRGEDANLRKLKAQLNKKFGELKGGIG